MGHRRDEKERILPEYSFDYCFPGDELGYKWTVLVGKERESGAYMGTAVPNKGGCGMFTIDRCLDFIAENGDESNPSMVKSDQEEAIKYVMKELVEARKEGRTVVEESPAMDSQSNGIGERAVQEVTGRIRCLWVGLQMRLGRELDARERIAAFMPDYSSYLLNHLKVGEMERSRMKEFEERDTNY